MSAFAHHAEEYLRLRRALGHQLSDAGRLLPRFVAYLDATGATVITVEAALNWVRRPDADPAGVVWLHRMMVVRGFARHMLGIDPHTQVPPLGLVTCRRHRRPPFIYSTKNVRALIAEVPKVIPTPLRAATFQTMIGLLASTGMRVGEVLALGCQDVDWEQGVLTIRNTKFGKSREIPVHRSTMEALQAYRDLSLLWVRKPAVTFFTTTKATPIFYTDCWSIFRQLLVRTGVGANSPVTPRIHDLRHSFAVTTLLRWYKSGKDVGALLPRLSTYMGHLTPSYTYWYLSASPQLLAAAARRLQTDGRTA